MSDVREIDINLIKIDPEIQPRERLNRRTLELFYALYRDEGPEALPPIVVYHDTDDVLWLSDGHYRYHAARDALNALNLVGSQRVLRAEVRKGSRRDAIFYAAEANGKHGTPLTWKEKRRVVERLLQDDEWRKMSDSAIARHVGVSNGFVSGIHRELRNLDSQQESLHDAKIPLPRTTTYVRGGKEITIRSDKIGRGRSKKAKTASTATPPASPSFPQVEPTTDEIKERTADDALEIVEADTTTSINDPKDVLESTSDDTLEAVTNDTVYELDDGRESAAYQEAVTTEGFKYLQVAWETATDEDRHAFLLWIKADQDQKRWHEADSALKSVIMTRNHRR